METRLSGGFHAAKFVAKPAGETSGSPAPLSKPLQHANDAIAEALPSVAPSKAELLRGEFQLASGNASQALEPLRKAAEDLKDDPEAQNDYGSVLYETKDYEDALVQFQKALHLKPDMREALTNVGICYQKLLLMDQAKDFFQRDLAHEPDKTWKQELGARVNTMTAPSSARNQTAPADERLNQILGELSEATAKQDRDIETRIFERNHDWLWNQMLIHLPKRYLQARRDRQVAEADLVLSKLQSLNLVFQRLLGDSVGEDTVKYLTNLPDDQLDTQLALYSREADLYSDAPGRDYHKAAQMLEELATDCDRSGNGCLRCIAQMSAVYYYYYAQNFDDAIRLSDIVFSEPTCRDWKDFRGDLLLQIGMCYSQMGQFSEALRRMETASSLCPVHSSTSAKWLQYRASTLRGLGDLKGALDNLRQSTLLYLAQGPSDNLAYNYLEVGDIYRIQGRTQLALLYGQKALSVFNTLNRTAVAHYIAQAASFNAERQATLRDFVGASNSLKMAYAAAKEAKAQPIQSQTLVLTRAGEVALKEGDTLEAVHDYQEAEKLATGSNGGLSPAVDALRGLAQTYRLTGNLQQARLSLNQAIDLIEKSRNAIVDPAQKTQYLDLTHSVYEDLISLEAEPPVNNPEAAFAASEQSRGRTLLDQMNSLDTGKNDSPAGASPISLSALKAALPSDLVLVEYAVTDDTTYIFAVTKAGLKKFKSPAKTDDLNIKVSRYLELLRSPESGDAWKVPARELYDALIQPVRDLIPNDATVCVIPDRILDAMPFAALLGRDEQCLLAANPLIYAPSASILKLCLDESRHYEATPVKSILSVGNPAFDSNQFPTLENLPAAVGEAKDAAAPYAERHTLIEKDATESELRRLIPDVDIVHVASHCLVDNTSPWRAELVLAKPPPGPTSSQNDGVLRLDEIHELNLSHTRLVVLSSCESALGQYYKGEGLASLVKPFIAARVPMVVASLWKVEAQPTAALFADFHKRYVNNKQSAALALRDAQLQLSHRSEYGHPYFWASFIAVGD